MSRKKPRRWVPMVRASSVTHGVPDHLLIDIQKIAGDFELWGNGDYTVAVRTSQVAEGMLVHLSIHDLHKTSRHDWRDLQRIKNDILGLEEEAVEIYPAESRLVDISNEFHLWSIVGARLPFGYNERLVSETGIDIGAKQRPWPEGDKPKDLKDISEELIKHYAKKGLT